MTSSARAERVSTGAKTSASTATPITVRCRRLHSSLERLPQRDVQGGQRLALAGDDVALQFESEVNS